MTYRWRKVLVVGGALAAAALLFAPPASASPRVAFAATFQNTSTVVTGIRHDDGNTFISQIVQVIYAGDFLGSVVEHADAVIHPDGTFNVHGADVCSCTLTGTGRSGTIVLPFTATGDASGAVRGRFTIRDGTGGLAGIHGVGRFESSNGSSGTFSGAYRFNDDDETDGD